MGTIHCGAALLLVVSLLPNISHSQEDWLADVTNKSHLIVTATIVETESKWDADHRFIRTRVYVNPTTCLKGSVRPGYLIISMFGGQVGDTAMVVPNTPSFRDGEEALLFLRVRNETEYGLTSWTDGKFVIENPWLVGNSRRLPISLLEEVRRLARRPEEQH